MNLYDVMNNITGVDKEKTINAAITNVKQILNGLITEQTCKIYSSYLLRELTKMHLTARLINTLNLGLVYEHEFILVPNTTNYYLIDLTFQQFPKQSSNLENLLKKGYQLIDNQTIKDYINTISPIELSNDFDLDSIFYNNELTKPTKHL